jgi:hypothetical protein
MKLARPSLLVVSICLAAPALFAADIRGEITNVQAAANNPNSVGFIRVEGNKERDTQFDKASIRVTPRTAIFKIGDGKKVAAKFSEFKVGQTVEATFTGPVAESYPVQATASEIVILKSADAEPSPAPPRGEAAVDIRGKITRLMMPDPREDSLVRYLHVAGNLEKDTRYDKANVRVPTEVRVFKIAEGKKVDAKYTELKQGQLVEIIFKGAVSKSQPVQASAAEIVILRDSDEPPQPQIHSRGVLSAIQRGNQQNFLGSITIKGGRQADTIYGDAIGRVTNDTRIFRKTETGTHEARFGDLKIGQRVELTYAGPVTRSIPPQGVASIITILPKDDGESDEVPLVKAGMDVELDGTLRGGVMAIGGETTGWVLLYDSNHGRRSIEVDVSGVKQGAPRAGNAIVKGKVVLHHYPERGPTLILKATRIESVATGNAMPP